MADSSSSVWVAGWLIDWHDYEPSFGVVGVATSQEQAEQLLAAQMVNEFGGTMLDRQGFPEAVTWLGAIARTCLDGPGPPLSEADFEFLIQFHVVAAE